jgi:aryl-alcohol dehydrogenase-like predicted oxidoreductase
MREMTLGEDGPVVSALGFGCLTLNGGRTGAAEAVRRAVEGGVTLFDTADYYGQGASEEALGAMLGADRDRVLLASKTGVVHREGGPPGLDGSPARIREACEGSLRRLGTDRLDLYLLARVDRQVPIEESVGAMAELVAEGKVRHVGLSEAAPHTLKRAQAVHPIAVLQTEYSLWERHVEERILPACRELGVGFMAYRPLGLGMLSDESADLAALPPGDWRRRDPRFQDATIGHNRELAAGLRRVAAVKGVTAAQLALAWLLDRDVVPVVGMLSPEHVTANLGAASVTLTDGERDVLEALFAPGTAAGPRCAPPLLATVDTDEEDVLPPTLE